MAASEIFDAGPDRVKHVDASLSLQCRNLASRSALRSGRRWVKPGDPLPPLSREALVGNFRSQRALYERLRLPGEVAWAQPSVVAMAELLHELRLK